MRIRKPLSILLICAMIITMLPVMSFAGDEDGQTAEVSTKKSISLNAGDITELDYIYYGKWKGNSIKWICPCCGAIVRSTKILNIVCGDCNEQFIQA